MSLQLKITALAQAIGADVKTLLANQGNLASLTTTQKGNLVAAINELNSALAGVVVIDDAAGVGVTNKAYSADKVITLLAGLKSEILGGAGAAFDTLQELETALQGEQTATTNILTALGNRVRFDAAQALTSPQSQQARDNIGALAVVSVGDTERDFAADYATAKL